MRAALMLVATLAATPAAALRCAPPDPMASVRTAAAASEVYRVLVGRLDFDDRLLPPPVGNAPPPSARPDVPARLSGVGLETGSARVPVEQEVVIRPSCAGPWCGWIPSGETWLVLAREEGASLVVEVGPCGGWAFMTPTEAQVGAVEACLAGGACGG